MNPPNSTCELGRQGEALAATYLQNEGYQILERNYRFRHNEIDLIALDGSTLCFVEVKARLSNKAGSPLDAVTVAKQREIIRAAQAYLTFSGQECDCRFDVIGVNVHAMHEARISSFTIEHIKDAFWVER